MPSRLPLLLVLWRFGPVGYILAALVMVLVRTVAFAVLVAPMYAAEAAPGAHRLRTEPSGKSAAQVAKDAKIAMAPLRFLPKTRPDGTTTFSLDPAQQRYLEAQARRITVPKGFFTDTAVSDEMRAAPRTLYLWTAVMIVLLLGCAALARRLPLAGGVVGLGIAFVGYIVLALFNARSAMDLWGLYSPVLLLLLFAAGAGAVNRDRPVEMMWFYRP